MRSLTKSSFLLLLLASVLSTNPSKTACGTAAIPLLGGAQPKAFSLDPHTQKAKQIPNPHKLQP